MPVSELWYLLLGVGRDCAGGAPSNAAATCGNVPCKAGGVTEVSVTVGGCRLVRQIAVPLQRTGSSAQAQDYCRLQLPAQLARALLCEDVRSHYTLVGESGFQQPVDMTGDDSLCTVRSFNQFRMATGIPPGSTVLVAVCENDQGHLHVAVAPAAGVQQSVSAVVGSR